MNLRERSHNDGVGTLDLGIGGRCFELLHAGCVARVLILAAKCR